MKAHTLLAYPQTAARMGDAGRARVAEHFGVAHMVEHYAQVYSEVAG